MICGHFSFVIKHILLHDTGKSFVFFYWEASVIICFLDSINPYIYWKCTYTMISKQRHNIHNLPSLIPGCCTTNAIPKKTSERSAALALEMQKTHFPYLYMFRMSSISFPLPDVLLEYLLCLISPVQNATFCKFSDFIVPFHNIFCRYPQENEYQMDKILTRYHQTNNPITQR